MTIAPPAKIGDKSSDIDKDKPGLKKKLLNLWKNQRKLSILLLAVIVAAVLAAGYAACQLAISIADANKLHVSGRIESPETHISAPAATRVKSVMVKEGDTVHKGQLIVTLDSQDLQKKIDESGPALKEALNARRQTDRQVNAVQHQIGEARAKSHGLFAKLFSTKSGREKQATQLRGEMMQAKMMSFQARSAVAEVQGAQAQGTEKLSYFNITSPIDGICATRSTEPGELVAAGQIMLTLVDPDSAYLRGFVPEGDIARIKIGQPAEVFLDANSTKALSGRVRSIDAAPSFTPENVYFKKDRLRQAFGITISIDHPNGQAKPGMSAEANILFNSKQENN